MKERYRDFLRFLASEALHLSVLTAFVCCFGVVICEKESPVTFWDILYAGSVSFWVSGVGQIVLLGSLGIGGIWLCRSFSGNLDDEDDSQASMAQEGTAKAVPGRGSSEASDEHARAIEKIEALTARLKRTEERFAWDREMFEQRWSGLEEKELKARAWQKELQAIRKKEEEAKERRINKNRHIRWALDARAESP